MFCKLFPHFHIGLICESEDSLQELIDDVGLDFFQDKRRPQPRRFKPLDINLNELSKYVQL